MDKVIFRGKADPNGSYGLELNKALEECAGKAVLVIEKGVYPTGPIDIPSHTRLVLEEGAELSFIPNFSRLLKCCAPSIAVATTRFGFKEIIFSIFGVSMSDTTSMLSSGAVEQ